MSQEGTSSRRFTVSFQFSQLAPTTSVPAMVSDLIESQLVGYGLETLIFGGSPAHDQLPAKGKRAFPTAVM